MNKRWIKPAALALFVMTTWSVGAVDTTITADTLTYNGNEDTAQAKGNVVITRGTAKMTGAEGIYHFADQSATLSGSVSYVDGATSLTAATVTAYADQSLAASGGVEMHAEDRTLRGATVTYRPSDGYGTIDGNAYLAVPGTEMTAGHVEAYVNEIRMIGTGGVSLSHPAQAFTATADAITYTQTPGADDGFAVLTGNAHAVQNGNTLNGPALEVRLKEQAVETKGRSTLVISGGR